MDEDIKKRLDEQDQKLAAIYKSTEITRKMFLWTLIITVVMMVLPMIGLVVVIPIFLNNIMSSFDGLL